MKKYIQKIILMMSVLLGCYTSAEAYITLPSTSYTLEVGVDKYLAVPDASRGYIDHAVWACNNANISFKEKDAAGAIIYIARSFSGQAVIELLATEKYLDGYGHTRALTYYKQYIITCIGGGGGGEVSEILLPENISLNLGETKQYKVISGNFDTAAYTFWWKESNPTNCVVISGNPFTCIIELTGAMAGNAILHIKTVAGDEMDCKITVTAPKVPSGRRTEEVAIADIKSLIGPVLSMADYSSIDKIIQDDPIVQPIDFSKPMDIYNLSGQKVHLNFNQLSKGVYILRQGNNVRKIIVKE